jgi:hypothetical protein
MQVNQVSHRLQHELSTLSSVSRLPIGSEGHPILDLLAGEALEIGELTIEREGHRCEEEIVQVVWLFGHFSDVLSLKSTGLRAR